MAPFFSPPAPVPVDPLDSLEGYFEIVHRALFHGRRKPSRSGAATLSLCGPSYEVDLSKGFPLLMERRIPWKNVVVELLWYLKGSTNIDFLQRHGVPIWDKWAGPDGEVAAGYGRHFRAYGESGFDQVAQVIYSLASDPYSRRHVITAWDPASAFTANPPPCVIEQTYVVDPPHEADPNQQPILNLCLTQRSADLGIGVPHNLACYALLVHLLCRFCDLRPGKIVHTMHDAHLYVGDPDDPQSAEFDQVGAMVELLRRRASRSTCPPAALFPLPELHLSRGVKDLDFLVAATGYATTDELLDLISIRGYKPLMPAIRMTPAP